MGDPVISGKQALTIILVASFITTTLVVLTAPTIESQERWPQAFPKIGGFIVIEDKRAFNATLGPFTANESFSHYEARITVNGEDFACLNASDPASLYGPLKEGNTTLFYSNGIGDYYVTVHDWNGNGLFDENDEVIFQSVGNDKSYVEVRVIIEYDGKYQSVSLGWEGNMGPAYAF